ncbi:MAG: hypothetical protein Q7R39_03915, partial [Dehalococcoidia bacterium]|nr:hypothetical protein [Dehalococcoidia bacterium]
QRGKPSIASFIDLLRDDGVKALLRDHPSYRPHLELVQTLPDGLRWLRNARNTTQYDFDEETQRKDLAPYVTGFLGIGSNGLLPRLVSLYLGATRTS